MMSAVAANFEMAVLFDSAYAIVFDVARHDAGKCSAQVRGELVLFLLFMQSQIPHVVMGGDKRLLKHVVDLKQPIEIVGIACFLTKLPHPLNTRLHFLRDQHRIINNDFVTLLRGFCPRCRQ